MPEEQVRTCSDCDGKLQPIVVMDKAYPHFGTLQYRAADDKKSFWTGAYPTAGPIQVYLCQGCGRVAWYGQSTAPAE